MARVHNFQKLFKLQGHCKRTLHNDDIILHYQTSHTSMNFTRKLTDNQNKAWFIQIDADASYTNTSHKLLQNASESYEVYKSVAYAQRFRRRR